MKTTYVLGLVAFIASLGSARAQLIEGDNFGQNPPVSVTQGSGIAIENPQNAGDEWTNVNTNNDNDTLGNGVANVGGGSGGFAKLVAPFDPTSVATPYTLSFTLSFNPGTATGFFFYGGLGNAPNATGFVDYEGSLMFNSQGEDLTGTSFTLYGGTGTTSNTLSATISRASTSVSYSMNVAINVDPTTNVDTFYVNGTSIGTVNYTGVIGQVWFKDQGNAPSTDGSNGINISNFAIIAVPEPSSWALLLVGLGMWSCIARRRLVSIRNC